jgi:hypothetical protein
VSIYQNRAMTHEDVVVGIIARSDLLRVLAGASPHTVATDDKRIQADISAELSKQSWSGGPVRVHVENGVAELSGTILDERARLAARRASEQTTVDRRRFVVPSRPYPNNFAAPQSIPER